MADVYDLYSKGDEEARRRACPDCGPKRRRSEGETFAVFLRRNNKNKQLVEKLRKKPPANKDTPHGA